jgi:hypothetical protein
MKITEYKEKIEEAHRRRIETANAVARCRIAFDRGEKWEGPTGRELLVAHVDRTNELLKLMHELCQRLRKIGQYDGEKKIREQMIPMQRERNQIESAIKEYDSGKTE